MARCRRRTPDAVNFFGVGTGYTPTASEVYGIRTARIAPVAPLQALLVQSIAPTIGCRQYIAEQTFTVTGLVAGSAVWVNKPSFAERGSGIGGARLGRRHSRH
jgi:hypothetical protein